MTGAQRVLAKRPVRAARMIVLVDEPPKQSSQMTLVQHDDVVQQLSGQGPDHAFRVWILPRRPSRSDHFLDAQIFDAMPEAIPVDAIPIPQQVP